MLLTPSFAADIRQTLESFRRSIDQFFDTFCGTTRRGTTDEWVFSPAVETGWTDEYLNLRVVLPGVSEKDLKVSVQGNTLVVEGERKPPKDFGKEGYVYTTMPYGRFERVIDLPNGLDLDKLTAVLHDGVLDIQIPLTTAMKPRQIPIRTEERKALAA
jgi:HSP20 family protein